MKNDDIIFHELKGLSPLIAQINRTNVYSVSSFYFDHLSTSIIEKLRSSKKMPYNLSDHMPYIVPGGYFEDLSEQILRRVHAVKEQLNEVFEETESIAPILNTISKNAVYTVPDYYFKQLEIPTPEAKKEPVKVVSINRGKIFRFSAAAAVVLLFTASLYTITRRYDSSSLTDTAKNKVKGLTKEEIVHFLKLDISTQNVSSAANRRYNNENAIKSSLKEISDREIQRFLKETGELDEI